MQEVAESFRVVPGLANESTHQPKPRGLRILLIGVNYAPETTGIAPYSTGLAEHLFAQGHSVSVITGLPSYPQWQVYEEYRGVVAVRETLNGVDVRRRWNYLPSTQTGLRRGLYEVSFAITGSLVRLRACPDAIIGIVPSLSGGVLARTLSARLGAPYGLILQDLIGPASRQSGMAGTSRLAGIVSRIEGWVARGASAVGIIAEGFRPYLMYLGVPEDRIIRLRNWTHIAPPTVLRADIRARFGWNDETTVCLHAGNMGYKQALENVIEAARMLVGQPLTFVLMGDGSQRSEIEQLARTYSLPNLVFLPIQAEEDFPNLLEAADILLLNQRGSVTNMSLPGKLTSYFAAGRPIVAAAAHTSESAREIRSAAAGVVVAPDEPIQLAQAVARLSADRELGMTMGQRGTRYASAFLTPESSLPAWETFVGRVAARAG